jgi:tRNA(fMet)-specific endonuclease VapC
MTVAFLLDTNVAIHLRDGDPMVTQKVAALQGAVLISIVTRVELEGGVYREPAHGPIRRARLDAMLNAIPALAFDDIAAKTYRAIVASAGYSRRKLLDQMIAAQALEHRATLVTFYPDDFPDVPGLSSIENLKIEGLKIEQIVSSRPQVDIANGTANIRMLISISRSGAEPRRSTSCWLGAHPREA